MSAIRPHTPPSFERWRTERLLCPAQSGLVGILLMTRNILICIEWEHLGEKVSFPFHPWPDLRRGLQSWAHEGGNTIPGLGCYVALAAGFYLGPSPASCAWFHHFLARFPAFLGKERQLLSDYNSHQLLAIMVNGQGG